MEEEEVFQPVVEVVGLALLEEVAGERLAHSSLMAAADEQVEVQTATVVGLSLRCQGVNLRIQLPDQAHQGLLSLMHL